MIVTTTPTIENHPIEEYLGIVTGEAILGAHIGRDILPASPTSLAGAPMSTRKRCARPATSP
jgi:uncharacterized protein YbjQ (UPF0145 family)